MAYVKDGNMKMIGIIVIVGMFGFRCDVSVKRDISPSFGCKFFAGNAVSLQQIQSCLVSFRC